MSKLQNGATASMNANWLHEHDEALREQIAKEIADYMGNYPDDFSRAITKQLINIARDTNE